MGVQPQLSQFPLQYNQWNSFDNALYQYDHPQCLNITQCPRARLPRDEGAITLGATAASVTDLRAGAIEEIAENRQSAIDYYVFVRDAYLQNRAKRVNEGTVPPDDDLYDTDGL